MTDHHNINILRIRDFRLFTLDHQGQTLTVLQLGSDTDTSPLLALTQLQAVQLRDALGKSEHAGIESLWENN